ncbi:hypothetical protein ACR6C2_16605 [Streptomyces sp. INA 01156]
MKLSEFIANAEYVLAVHGDIPVLVPDTGCGCCRDYTFNPAEGHVAKNVSAYDETFENGRTLFPSLSLWSDLPVRRI